MASLEQHWREWQSNGQDVVVIGLHPPTQSLAPVVRMIQDWPVHLPLAVLDDRCHRDFDNVPNPYGFVVGINGRIVWEGDPDHGGMYEAADQALEMVVPRPWLDNPTFDDNNCSRGLRRYVSYLNRQRWSSAIEGLQEEVESGRDTDEAQEYLDAVRAIAQERWDKIQAWDAEGRYYEAWQWLQSFPEDFAPFDDLASEASTLHAAYQDDAHQAVIEAGEEFYDGYEELCDDDQRRAESAWESVAEDHPDTPYADLARTMLGRIR